MTSSLTRSGSHRYGDEYQDIVAIDKIVQMMMHPERIRWIKIEDDEAGSLDDVIVCRQDGTIEYTQVKFAVSPEETKLSWDWLLEQRKSRKKDKVLPSLLQKWAKTLNDLRNVSNDVGSAVLVTNRVPDEDFRYVLNTAKKIDFKKISNEGIKSRILKQLGGIDETNRFFGTFEFSVDQLSLNVYQQSVRTQFTQLGGTSIGWYSLCDDIRIWVKHKNFPEPDGRITLEIAKQAAKWNKLRSFDEEFEIPGDFILPSASFHENLVHQLSQKCCNCIVVTGSPGVGKSTYLSYLYAQLKELEQPVVRHHYFLSLQERTPMRRFDSALVAESLMSEILYEHPHSVSSLARRNPNPAELKEWLEEAGQYFSASQKKLIVMLDGLDHVWREQGSIAPIVALLDMLLPCPIGITLVLGTQPLDESQIPRSLARFAPRETWLPLPLLDEQGVEKWLQHHMEVRGTSTGALSGYQMECLCNAFFEQSCGHPLHLRYTFLALRQRELLITADNVRLLPPCSHAGIEKYYSDLVLSLTAEGRQILHLISACPFPWPESGIRDTLDPTGVNIPQIETAIREIRHLLVDKGLGLLPFHGSLCVFISTQPEHAKVYERRMKHKTLSWLQSPDAPEYWKWAFEWTLQYELGNSEPLLKGPTREWVTKAIGNRFPRNQMSEILSRSAYHSLEVGDLVRALEVATLRDYLENTFSSRDMYTSELIRPVLLLRRDPYLLLRLESELYRLKDAELLAIAECSNSNNAAKCCFDELNRRVRLARSARRHQTDHALLLKQLTETAIYAEVEIERIVKFIEDVGDAEINNIFAEVLRRRKNMGGLRVAMRLAKGVALKEELFKEMVILSLYSGVNIDKDVRFEHNRINEEYIEAKSDGIEFEPLPEPFIGIYHKLRNTTDFLFVGTTFPNVSNLLNLQEHEHYRNEREVFELFYNCFFCFLANHLQAKADTNYKWLDNIVGHSWPLGFLQILNEISMQCAEAMNSKSYLTFSKYYNIAATYKRPVWFEDREFHEYGTRAESSLHHIVLDSLHLSHSGCASVCIDAADIATALKSDYFNPWIWLRTYNKNGSLLMTPAALNTFNHHLDTLIASSIETFDDRSENYVALALLNAKHGCLEKAERYVKLAAENLFTHGYHKDILFHDVIESLETCYNAGSGKIRKWLLQLAPAIAEIANYTDGDETNHVPKVMGQLLAKACPNLIPSYYDWLCNRGEFWNAESLFHAFLENSELNTPVTKAIASTAIDRESIKILEERSLKLGNEGAREALERVTNFLCVHKLDNSLTETKSEPAKHQYQEKTMPPPSDYPPERINEYINSIEDGYPARITKGVTEWFQYWRATNRHDDSYAAVVALFRAGADVGCFSALFEYALEFTGKEEAYEWLVQDMKNNSGWYHVMLRESRDVTKARWENVKKYYPNKWYEFIVDTLKSDGNTPWLGMTGATIFPQIVAYCIFMGQQHFAESIADCMVCTSLELVSPLNLPVPKWTNGE